jgi:protein gp37
MSKIEWTQKTWNPVVGCDKVSAGCKNCYAMRMAYRLMHNPNKAIAKKYAETAYKTTGGSINWTGKINIDHNAFKEPVNNKKPTVYFVNSMSDLFHEGVHFETIIDVFLVMCKTPWHTYQVLTKRAERMLEFMTNCAYNPYGTPFEPLKNVWLGVSVEDQKAAGERIPYLLETPAAVRFLSCEPLLGPVDLKRELGAFAPGNNSPLRSNWLNKIHWVIAGGESGPGARPMHPDWARSLRDQCITAGVPFFFKQWGEYLPFEPTAQAPFYRRCDNNEEYDGHGLNFIDAETGEAGKYGGFYWYDVMDAILMNIENYSSDCNYLKCGKKAAGRLLDGKLHDEYPVQECDATEAK